MANVNTFTKSGTKATTAAKLSKDIFGVVPENHTLIKEAYVAYMANGRENLAVVKTRGLVRGGGKKPWKQKGTGRARFGSSRNPIWRGGGIVFGPTGEENYTKKINVKAKRLALKQALSIAAEAGKIVVIEDLVSKEGKTSELVRLFDKIGVNPNRRTLVAVDHKEDMLVRAVRNVTDLKLVQANYLNVFDVMNADTIVMTNAALDVATKWLEDTTTSTREVEAK